MTEQSMFFKHLHGQHTCTFVVKTVCPSSTVISYCTQFTTPLDRHQRRRFSFFKLLNHNLLGTVHAGPKQTQTPHCPTRRKLSVTFFFHFIKQEDAKPQQCALKETKKAAAIHPQTLVRCTIPLMQKKQKRSGHSFNHRYTAFWASSTPVKGEPHAMLQ